jgi:flagellar motor protein MotB
MNHGVVGTRISTSGYGDTVPLNDNSTPEKRKQNRRVEIKILKK